MRANATIREPCSRGRSSNLPTSLTLYPNPSAARSTHPGVTTGGHADGQLFEPPLQTVVIWRVFFLIFFFYLGAGASGTGVGRWNWRMAPPCRPLRPSPAFRQLALHRRWKSRFQLKALSRQRRRQSIDAHKPVEATAIKPNEAANTTAIGSFHPTEPVA
jgi:hypothetical protein